MNNRQTVHYTVELLQNGNFNIYDGTECVQRNLVWGNISPTGAAECLGGWVITWAKEAEKVKTQAETNDYAKFEQAVYDQLNTPWEDKK